MRRGCVCMINTISNKMAWVYVQFAPKRNAANAETIEVWNCTEAQIQPRTKIRRLLEKISKIGVGTLFTVIKFVLS